MKGDEEVKPLRDVVLKVPLEVRQEGGRPIFVQSSGVMVSYLPYDHPDSPSFTITVEWRGGDRWAVCWSARRCLSQEGTWDYEPSPSNREDDWVEAHRFTRDKALALAVRMAPTLRASGYTVTEIREEWERKDNEPSASDPTG